MSRSQWPPPLCASVVYFFIFLYFFLLICAHIILIGLYTYIINTAKETGRLNYTKVYTAFTSVGGDHGALGAVAPVVYRSHAEHVGLSALQSMEEATLVDRGAGRREPCGSRQGGGVGRCARSWIPGRTQQVGGAFHSALDVDGSTRDWKRMDASRSETRETAKHFIKQCFFPPTKVKNSGQPL